MKNILSTFSFLLLFILVSATLYGQEKSRNSLTYGFGLGLVTAPSNTMISGYLLTAGFQRNIWKDRLRFNPAVSLGSFSANYIDFDTGFRIKRLFAPIGLESVFYYDVFKVKSFSFVLGLGGLVNYSREVVSRGTNSNFETEFAIAWCFKSGIRFEPKSSKFGFNLIPLNLSAGSSSYTHFYSRMGVEIKL